MRGISTAVGMVIAMAIIVTVLLPFAINYYMSISSNMSSQAVYIYRLREKLYVPLSVSYDTINLELELENTGTKYISITGIVFKNKTDASLVYVRATGLAIVDGSKYIVSTSTQQVILEPSGKVVYSIPPELDPLYVVTKNGVVIDIKRTGNVQVARTTQTASALEVNAVTFFSGNLLDQVNSGQIQINPSLLAPPTPQAVSSGVTNGTFRVDNYGNEYPLVMYYEAQNVSVIIEMAVPGNVLIGYDPDWERSVGGVGSNPEYSILITSVFALYDADLLEKNIGQAVFMVGDYSWRTTDSSRSGGIIWYYNGTATYDSIAYIMEQALEGRLLTGWRIKIMGFKPSEISIKTTVYNRLTGTSTYEWLDNDKTLGKWLYAGFKNLPLTIVVLRGTARDVRFYAVDESLEGYPSSYDPYLFIADTDGNGYPEINFVTEDIGWGHVGTYNDMATYYMDEVSYLGYAYYAMPDYCNEAFEMVFTGIPIDGSKYSEVRVDVRLYFHDNLGDDIDEVEYSDRSLLGVLLIDADTGKVVSGTTYTYQQLAPWEDTYPPNENFITLSIPLLVPNIAKTYYVAFMFYDPYSYLSGGYDDGDFIMGLEFIGITYYARG